MGRPLEAHSCDLSPFFFLVGQSAVCPALSHLERESCRSAIPLFDIEKHNPGKTNLVTLVLNHKYLQLVLNHKYLLLEKKQPLSKRVGGCYLIIVEL